MPSVGSSQLETFQAWNPMRGLVYIIYKVTWGTPPKKKDLTLWITIDSHTFGGILLISMTFSIFIYNNFGWDSLFYLFQRATKSKNVWSRWPAAPGWARSFENREPVAVTYRAAIGKTSNFAEEFELINQEITNQKGSKGGLDGRKCSVLPAQGLVETMEIHFLHFFSNLQTIL